MAVPEKVIDRETSNILLPAEISQEIWTKAVEESAFMRLAQRRNLPGQGEEFQIITKDPEPGWVGEAEPKPIGEVGLDKTSWKGYKLAVILTFSNEFRRDLPRLYSEIVDRVPAAFGKKIDATVFGDGKEPKSPGELFDTMADVPEIDITEQSLWDALVAGDAAVSAADGIANGLAISPAFKSALLTECDANQRPLFVNDMTSTNNVPAVMGCPTYLSRGVHRAATQEKGEQLGFLGDWTHAYFGVVEDISMKITDTATVNDGSEDIHLWQRNMFAVLFEMTVGSKLRDKKQFVKFVGAKSE